MAFFSVQGPKKGWDLVTDFQMECEQSDFKELRLDWEYNQYMLDGKQLLVKDHRGNQIIVLKPGNMVPTANGYKQVPYSIMNYPVDPHIMVISQSITAQALANELRLQVQNESHDTNGRKIAKNSDTILDFYVRDLKFNALREEALEWMKPCGSAFIKIWQDPDDGLTVRTTDGKTRKTGKIKARVAVPFAMMIPSGVTKMDDLHMIGEKTAMSVSEIKRIYKKDVPEETGLRDIKKLDSGDMDTSELKGHAMVYEIFCEPGGEYGDYGYHVIAAGGEVLNESDYFNQSWQSKFPNRWHPYVMIPYIKRNKFWPASMFDRLMPMQNELNKKRKQNSDSKKEHKKPIIVSDPNGVDWERVDLDPEKGWPRIERKTPGAKVDIVFPQPYNQDGEQDAQALINRMNDLSGISDVARGKTSPSVTSGKQVEKLQNASNVQGGPLMHNLAEAFCEAGKIVLELASVHLTKEQLKEITGRNNETIPEDFEPQDINTKNIEIFGGNAYYLTPEGQAEQIDQLAAVGALGNMQDNRVRTDYLKLKRMPDLEGFYDSAETSSGMAEHENSLFAKGQLEETNPQIIDAIMKEYQAAQMQAVQAAAAQHLASQQQNMQVMQDAATGKIPAQQMQQLGAPPIDEPLTLPVIPEPVMWRRAREWDDDDIHIQNHDKFRETPEFEDLCNTVPHIMEAMDFHKKDHLRNKVAKFQQMQQLAAPAQQPVAAPMK